VTSIGQAAFESCHQLAEIQVDENNPSYMSEDGVLFTKSKATIVRYPNGKSDSSYAIPNGVTSIGDSAFYQCSGLTNITIPDSVTSIGDGAFDNCYGLTNITIPDGVTSIGDSAFASCYGLTNITIPDSVTSIEDRAFWFCDGLTTITIPDSVTSIGDYAFYSCDSLTTITIPASVTSIGDSAFSDCDGLTTITIPDSVTSIGQAAFKLCRQLAEIQVDENNPSYMSKDGILFNKSGTTIVRYPNGKSDSSYTIPNGVTSIGESAFRDCDGLTTITIPDSVVSIEDVAFAGCDGLTTITIPDSVTSIGHSAFSNCYGLTNITIPDSVTSIGDGAFASCCCLTNITIPDSVTSIGESAFDYCQGLTSITIPNSVVSIGYGAFHHCNGLTNITIPDSVTSIANYAFDNCSSLTSITIPDSVTSIGEGAFWRCNRLRDVYYGGDETDWAAIQIGGNNNEDLTNATIHYNSNGGDVTTVGERKNFNGHTYQLLYSAYNWNEMQAYCESRGGHLACITTAEEDAFLYQYVNECYKVQNDVTNVVFGLTDDGDEGNWRWVSGEAVEYTNWRTGEPGDNEHWGEYSSEYPDGAWSGCPSPANCHYLIEWDFLNVPGEIDFAITTESLPDGVKYVPYASAIQTDAAADSRLRFGVTDGSLPSGLSVNYDTGEIYGVPGASGEFKFTIRATLTGADGESNQSATKEFTLNVVESTDEATFDEMVFKSTDPGYELTQCVGTPDPDNRYRFIWTDEYGDSVLISNGAFEEFVALYLDGEELERDVEYTVREGSAIVKIQAQTLRKNGSGVHTLSAEFNKDKVKRGTNMKRASQNYYYPPKTSNRRPNRNNGNRGGGSSSSGGAPSVNTPSVPSAPESAPMTFLDVLPSSWYYEDVKWAFDNKIMEGVNEQTFAPDSAISQGTIVLMLARMAKINLDQFKNMSVEGIPSGTWYTEAAIWAKQSGLVKDPNKFTGSDVLKRDEMAVTLVKFLRSLGKDTTAPAQPTTFADAADMSEQGKEAFQILYKMGVFKGVGNNRMDPNGTTTRAQFAALLHRLSDTALK